SGLDANSADALFSLLSVEEGPLLAEVLRTLGRYPKLGAAAKIAPHANAKAAEVRAATLESLAELQAPEGKEAALKLLSDPEAIVRLAAGLAVGKLAVKAAAEPLLKLATDPDAGVRAASLESLRRLREARSVPLAVAALSDRATQLTALELLSEMGG